MEAYNKEMEKEENDRRLLQLEWVIGILSCAVLFIPIFIGAYLPMKDWQRIVIVFSGFIPAFFGYAAALKIEQIAGYYACKHCGNRHVPSYKAVNTAMHFGRTRYLKCPACGKRSWQKKVIGRE